jgi:hypothetical protein
LTDSDVTIRPLARGELDLFDTLVLGGPACGPPDRDFLATAADHHYRPEWTWVAQRGDRVVARAAWWGGPDDAHPVTLDWFDLGPDDDRIAVGARLLQRAHDSGAVRTADGALAEFHLFLPPDGQERPEIRAAVEERVAAAEQAGLRPFVERLRFEWDRSAGVPCSVGPPAFRPGARRRGTARPPRADQRRHARRTRPPRPRTSGSCSRRPRPARRHELDAGSPQLVAHGVDR